MSAVEQFHRDGWIREPADIFALKARYGQGLQQLKNREGWGDKSAAKLFDAIDERRRIELNRVIFGLGIRHVGEVAAADLARHYGSWDAFLRAVDLARPAEQRHQLAEVAVEEERRGPCATRGRSPGQTRLSSPSRSGLTARTRSQRGSRSRRSSPAH